MKDFCVCSGVKVKCPFFVFLFVYILSNYFSSTLILL